LTALCVRLTDVHDHPLAFQGNIQLHVCLRSAPSSASPTIDFGVNARIFTMYEHFFHPSHINANVFRAIEPFSSTLVTGRLLANFSFGETNFGNTHAM
jgi:hypothetical protein